MVKGKPEDLFEPKLVPINLYAMAPAWVFYQKVAMSEEEEDDHMEIEEEEKDIGI